MLSPIYRIKLLSMVLVFDWANFGVSAGEEVSDSTNVENKEETHRRGEHEKRTTRQAVFGCAIVGVTWRQQVSGRV